MKYTMNIGKYKSIPGNMIAYWMSPQTVKCFEDGNTLESLTQCAAGVSSGDNDKYLKFWFEVPFNDVYIDIKFPFDETNKKYAFCNKGGEFRKWYGNNDRVALWVKKDEFHRNGSTYQHLLFKQGMTWSAVTTGAFNARYYPDGYIFDHASPSLFPLKTDNLDELLFFIGLSNSVVVPHFLKILNPTINTGADTLRKIPVFRPNNNNVSGLVKENIKLCKEDWDSFETSWDFKKHPLT